jgi:hypothetical protein
MTKAPEQFRRLFNICGDQLRICLYRGPAGNVLPLIEGNRKTVPYCLAPM